MENTKMRSNRILSTVDEDWGRSTVYDTESLPSVLSKKSQSATSATQKTEAPAPVPARAVSSVGFKEMTASSIIVPKTLSNFFDEDEDKNKMPILQSTLMATVLEDAITKFRILASSNNEMKIHKAMADMPLLIAQKYRVQQPAVIDELDGVDPMRLTCDIYKLNKLDYDRNFFEQVLLDTYSDLSLTRVFHALADHVNSIIDRDEAYEFLKQDEMTNRGIRRDLAKQLRQQRNHHKTVAYDTDVIIDTLRTQIEDAALNADIRSRYVDNWQNARSEQHRQTISDKEAVYGDVIEYVKQRSDHEQRVHSEVELLINIAINETLEKVEEWMNKYDKDMEAIDLRIQIKKNDYQNMLDRRLDLEQTIAKHDKLMKDWIYFKDEREKARQYREKMTKSAIIVQAWWRGLLVRLELGPYKVAKKKKPPKKK